MFGSICIRDGQGRLLTLINDCCCCLVLPPDISPLVGGNISNCEVGFLGMDNSISNNFLGSIIGGLMA